jgi:Spx/MgsR family transcriptional regulator
MIKFVGLKNCDTCRKAKKWLEGEGISFIYHDVRSDGLSKDDVTHWINELGWEELTNRRGTTWRNLSDEDKNSVNKETAVDLIVENPALMKRPLFICGDTFILGFKQAQMKAIQALSTV